MSAPVTQHQAEIEQNLRAWNAKPLLQEIYAGFYRRILTLIEPDIGWSSRSVYGLLHHEPVAWRAPINRADSPPSRDYYAAQGNATRLFFRKEIPGWPAGWKVFHAEAFSCFHYLLSGGYSK